MRSPCLPCSGAPETPTLMHRATHAQPFLAHPDNFLLCCSTLLDPIMGMVDTAIVGRLGTEPLAAVGLSTVLYNFSNFIWNFLLYTTTPRVAAAASRNDRAGVSAITSQGLWVSGSVVSLAAMPGASVNAFAVLHPCPSPALPCQHVHQHRRNSTPTLHVCSPPDDAGSERHWP